jgi:hypothetical protein
MQFTRFPNQLGKQTFFSPPSSPIYIFHLQALQILSSLYLSRYMSRLLSPDQRKLCDKGEYANSKSYNLALKISRHAY